MAPIPANLAWIGKKCPAPQEISQNACLCVEENRGIPAPDSHYNDMRTSWPKIQKAVLACGQLCQQQIVGGAIHAPNLKDSESNIFEVRNSLVHKDSPLSRVAIVEPAAHGQFAICVDLTNGSIQKGLKFYWILRRQMNRPF